MSERPAFRPRSQAACPQISLPLCSIFQVLLLSDWCVEEAWEGIRAPDDEGGPAGVRSGQGDAAAMEVDAADGAAAPSGAAHAREAGDADAAAAQLAGIACELQQCVLHSRPGWACVGFRFPVDIDPSKAGFLG